MYQYRPRVKPRYEFFMHKEQSSADPSTSLSGRPHPPSEIQLLVDELDKACPWLRRYEVGWVQINATDVKGKDNLKPHTDKPGWGDVIVVFTTMEVTLKLETGKSPAEISRTAATFVVPAGSAYILAGPSRNLAKHSATLPEGRIGVVLRYYLRDLCELGARGNEYLDRPDDRGGADVALWKDRIGEECVARWPSEKKMNIADRTYPSCYPGRIVDVVQEDETCYVLISFFLSEEGIRDDSDDLDDIEPVKVPCWMVLPASDSTCWFNDIKDPTGRQYREVINPRNQGGKRQIPKPLENRESIVDPTPDLHRGRPQRLIIPARHFDATILTQPCYQKKSKKMPITVEEKKKKTKTKSSPLLPEQRPPKKKKPHLVPVVVPEHFEPFSENLNLDDEAALNIAMARSLEDMDEPPEKKKKKTSRSKRIVGVSTPGVAPPEDLRPDLRRPYDDDDLDCRIAAFLCAFGYIPTKPTIGVPDAVWDFPALATFFLDDDHRRPPQKKDLIKLTKDHYDRLKKIYVERYDDDISPLYDRYIQSSSRPRRGGGP